MIGTALHTHASQSTFLISPWKINTCPRCSTDNMLAPFLLRGLKRLHHTNRKSASVASPKTLNQISAKTHRSTISRTERGERHTSLSATSLVSDFFGNTERHAMQFFLVLTLSCVSGRERMIVLHLQAIHTLAYLSARVAAYFAVRRLGAVLDFLNRQITLAVVALLSCDIVCLLT